MRNSLDLFQYDTEKEAIDFIKTSIKKDTAFVGFSGGKDSIVTADLIKKSGIAYTLFYSFTGIDPPEVVNFIKKEYPECIILKPKRTFWKNLSTNVPPSGRLRWCCASLKKEPGYKLLHKKRIMGIRAEESTKRSTYGQINYFEKLDHTHYYPIFHWKEWEIWDYIHNNKLKYPIVYDWGFDRLGCVICPFNSEKTGQKHKLCRKYWPKYFDLWEKEITKLFYKRQSEGMQMFYKTPIEFINAWYLNCSAMWYKKDVKKDKLDLF